MSWWKREAPDCTGGVYFRGPLPPRADSFERLRTLGVELRPAAKEDGFHWKLELSHATWGKATIDCPRDWPPPHEALVLFDPRLRSEDHLALVRAARTFVRLRCHTRSGSVLRDRKLFLRYLHAVQGEDGLLAEDGLTYSFWPRDAIDDELSHDADVDIQALFCVHCITEDDRIHNVTEDDSNPAYWLHTHGLRELGFVDFDVLNPATELHQRGYDLIRALAFGIVEGEIQADGGAYPLAQPNGEVRLVSVDRLAGAKGTGPFRAWGESLDDWHTKGHAIVCDPPGGLLRRLLGDPPRPSGFLSDPMPDEILIQFSHSASDLMAERARKTYGVFRSLAAEFGGLRLPILAKFGIRVDGGGPKDLEHLWIEVHACDESSIDGTLGNEPFHIARMKAGQRGRWDVALMSDWAIMTPFGQITPRSMSTARDVRRHRADLERAIGQHEKEGGAS